VKGRRVDAFFAISAYLMAVLISRIIKLAVFAPRPYLEGEPGYEVAGIPKLLPLVLIAALMLGSLLPKWHRTFFLLATSVAFLFGMSIVLDVVPATRGLDAFPSGHAAGALAAAVIAIVLTRSNRAWPAIVVGSLVIVLGVGISRIYLGAHYPADILAGWAVGLGSVATVWLLLKSRLNLAIRSRAIVHFAPRHLANL
jgi:membrane-associated phospholipid phosphatase